MTQIKEDEPYQDIQTELDLYINNIQPHFQELMVRHEKDFFNAYKVRQEDNFKRDT